LRQPRLTLLLRQQQQKQRQQRQMPLLQRERKYTRQYPSCTLRPSAAAALAIGERQVVSLKQQQHVQQWRLSKGECQQQGMTGLFGEVVRGLVQMLCGGADLARSISDTGG
jgi:hypothetical protein